MNMLNQRLGQSQMRVVILGLVFLSLVVALVLRLWFLQVLSSASYTKQAVANIARTLADPAQRGDILDRNGQVLANNVPSEVVSLDRSQFEVPKPTAADHNAMAITPQGQQVLNRLSHVLNVPVATLVARLNDPKIAPYAPAPVATNVPQNALFTIEEHQALGDNQFPGVIAQDTPMRNYPNHQLAANVLGYVGQITAAQVTQTAYKGDAVNSIIGDSGLEAQYERALHGTDGATVQAVDSLGNMVGTLKTTAPTPGQTLVTTLDLGVQTLVEQSLAQGIAQAQKDVDPTTGRIYPATAGGAVVMDPNNGQILAMASYPTFDPNQFVGGISTADYNALNNNQHPLINRVTQAAYPPGSTFKVVTSAAALQEGLASPSGSYACPASVRFFNQTFNNYEPTNSGNISLAQALIQSCDTVYYGFGNQFYGRFVNHQGELLQNYATAFGFGHTTGIDLPEGAPGLVGTQAWLKASYKANPKGFPDNPNGQWEPGNTIQMAIGQDTVLATPLQVADAYAAIANGGTLYQPELGLRVMDGNTVVQQMQPVVKGHLPVSPSNLADIRQGLEGVVNAQSGTANAAFAGFPLSQVPVAGKTGTADVGVGNNVLEPYAWFVSYAPANNPKYVVAVMLEQGGFGAQTAAPIARRILEGLNNLPLTTIGQGKSITG